METGICKPAGQAPEEEQNMKDSVNRCRKCGKQVSVITWGVYRKVLVDAAAVMVVADEYGEEFIRVDGSKLRGREVDFDSGESAEPAYRPHRKTCGIEE